MTVEADVAAHYTTGSLFERVRAALAALGVDPDTATVADLKACDEFHTGGIEATEALLDQLTITSTTDVLDIGSGIGGTARLLADRHGCRVVGVDLTPEFVETAAALSDMVGAGDRVEFKVGSALDLPVADASADLALLLHVGMNIENKARLFREARRALRPGGTLAAFDVMRDADDSALVFPLPWSERPETSFVAAPDVYRDAAQKAGLELVTERGRRDFALDFFARVFAKIEEAGPSPLGIHLMMRETAGEKLQNYVANVEARRIAPVEMIFRAPL